MWKRQSLEILCSTQQWRAHAKVSCPSDHVTLRSILEQMLRLQRIPGRCVLGSLDHAVAQKDELPGVPFCCQAGNLCF